MSKECNWCGRTYRGAKYDPYCSRQCQKAGRIDACGEDRELTIDELFGNGCKQIRQGVANEIKKYVGLGIFIVVIALLVKCCG